MNLIKNEPVLTAVYGLNVAAQGLLTAFGVALTQAQTYAVNGFVLASLGLALVVRNAVRPTRKPAPTAITPGETFRVNANGDLERVDG